MTNIPKLPQELEGEILNLSSDFTVCVNDSCPLRERCLRHLSHHKGFGISSYAHFNKHNEDDCDYFLPRFKKPQRLKKIKKK